MSWRKMQKFWRKKRVVDDGSEWSFENARSGAIGVGGFARDNSRRRLSKIIE